MTTATFLGLLMVWALLSVAVALAVGHHLARRGRAALTPEPTEAGARIGSVRPA